MFRENIGNNIFIEFVVERTGFALGLEQLQRLVDDCRLVDRDTSYLLLPPSVDEWLPEAPDKDQVNFTARIPDLTFFNENENRALYEC